MVERGRAELTVVESIPLRESSMSSEQLTYYLGNRAMLPESSFPRYVSAAQYSPIIETLYRQVKNVYVLGEQTRSRLLAEPKTFKRTYQPLVSFASQEFREIEEEFVRDVTQQAFGERMKLVYQDVDSEVVKTTDIIFGKYGSVEDTELYRLINAGKRLLMRVHSHPTNSFFSPEDLYPTLVDDGRGRPLIKGHVILCPDVQLMVLSTYQTPLMREFEARKLVDTWARRARGQEGEEGTALSLAIRRIEKEHAAFVERDLEKQVSMVESVQELVKGGGAFGRKRRRLTREAERAMVKFQVRDARYKQELERARNALFAYNNAQVVEFSRLIHMVPYISTNRKDFYRFTA